MEFTKWDVDEVGINRFKAYKVVAILLILICSYVHNLPGDNAYCSIFRNLSAYRQPRDFGDFLDAAVISYITDHRDQKITVIRDKSISLNVMFDFGLA